MFGLFNFLSKDTPQEWNQKSYGNELIGYPDSLLQSQEGFRHVNYHIAANDGFMKNYVVYRAITDIAESASQIPLVYDNPEVENLLRKPYYKKPYKSFIQDAIKYKLLSGNLYCHAVTVGKKIKLLELIRPDRIEIETGYRNGKDDQLLEYRWTQGNVKVFPVDDELNSEIFHSKLFNPFDEWKGMSLLQSAIIGVDQSNAMSKYNKSVVENNGTPSSLLVMKEPKDKMTPAPSEDQMSKLREQMDDKLGKNRKNSFAVVNWMYDAVRLGMTQQEMDWVNSKTTTAREIALALGYPPFLLGLAEGATFSNVAEARMSFYDNTVIPILAEILNDFEIYYESITGRQTEIMIDRDNILALQPRVFEKRLAAREDFRAGIISDVEARQEGNYPDEPESGERFMPSSQVPFGMDMNLFDNQPTDGN